METEEREELTPEKLAAVHASIEKQMKKSLQDGQMWYIVESKWYNNLLSFFQGRCENPGDCNNENLVHQTFEGTSSNNESLANQTFEGSSSNNKFHELKKTIVEGEEYVCMPQEAIETLVHLKFNFSPLIPRKVCKVGFTLRISLYPIYLQVGSYEGGNRKPEDPIKFIDATFPSCSLAEFKTKLKEKFNVKNKKCRIWSSYKGNPVKKEKKDEYKDVDDIFQNGSQVILEIHDGASFFFQEAVKPAMSTRLQSTTSSTSSTSSSSSYSSLSGGYSTRYSMRGHGSGGKPGVAGLSNLGNTCFMNSGLQCLTKIPEFHDYFLNEEYVEDINLQNPLGMQGKIARAFASLMKEMWSGGYSYVNPIDFKIIIGRYATQFSGYNQHDSQELICYLLDGLHEDLNKVKTKPPTSIDNTDGKSDTEVANEFWGKHLVRNNSVIVDHFHGQMKSQLQCPNCQKTAETEGKPMEKSRTFDPFMYLSLPLPPSTKKTYPIYFVKYASDILPSVAGYTVEIDATMGDLRREVAKAQGVPVKDIILCEIYQRTVFRLFSDDEDASKLNPTTDIAFAFEMPGLPDLSGQKFESHKFICTKYKKEFHYYDSRKLYDMDEQKSPPPMIIHFELGKTKNCEIYEECYKQLHRYLSSEVVKKINSVKFITNLEEYNKKKNDSRKTVENSEEEKPEKKETEEEEDEDVAMKDEEKETKTKRKPRIHDPNQKEDEEESEEGESESDDDEDLEKGKEKSESMEVEKNEESEEKIFFPDDIFSITVSDSKIPYDTEFASFSKFSTKIEVHLSFNDDNLFDQKKVVLPAAKSSIKKEEKYMTLDDCFKEYTKEEVLGENDKWYCPKCKEFVCAKKKIDIWRLPDVLIIHLKRFHYNSSSSSSYAAYSVYSMISRGEKISTFVDFPEELDMSAYCLQQTEKDNCQYELFAVSNHFGSLYGGHYTAYVKVDKEWFDFDDTSATPMSGSQAKTSAAYVLFYRRSTKKRE